MLISYKKILVDKYNPLIFGIDNNKVQLSQHNININSKENIDESTTINIFDINYDCSLVYYLKNNNLYSKALINNVYPSPGGEGGLLIEMKAL